MNDQPYLEQRENNRLLITDAGRQRLRALVTDTEGPVYAFTGGLPPAMVAAAMARLSRRGDDMRITLLDEFIDQADQDTALLRRVVTAYGDDSVQQLVGVQLVVENASNLLTKQLEWGRLASYLEQSTRYIYFDQVDARGRYRYHTPDDLSTDLSQRYEATMTGIFQRYSQMVRELTTYIRQQQPTPTDKSERAAWQAATRAQACDAIRPVLPVATRSTVGIFASAQATDNLIMHLLSSPLAEARATGQAIYDQAVKVIPAFLERTMRADRGLATVAYRANTRSSMRQLTRQLISQSVNQTAYATQTEPVKLLRAYPEAEWELVAEMLFAHSDLPLADIRQQVARWSKADMRQVLQTYFGERLNRRHRPGRALEIAHLEWEIMGDYGTFRDLQRHRIVDAFEWQDLSPQHGYEVPELVQQANQEETFRECFALAEELYELLRVNGHETEAQYATLLGHRMRYRFMANLRELFHLIELRTGPAGHPGYRKICQEMYRLLTEVYPLTASAMRFVNQDEDPALTRLAAERATQYKLARLGENQPG